ncbi:MAG: 4Fe-4S binding protein [Planctomycetaceae bacterium]|nr:4Fe-4S binding protein [Planctomycetaceae bacterium]
MTPAHPSPPVKTVSLPDVAARYGHAADRIARRIIICAGTGCVANGSLQVHRVLEEKLRAVGLDTVTTVELQDDHVHDVHLSRSGCQGFCQMGPLVTIEPDGILYTRVQLGDVDDIVELTLQQGEVVERLLYVEPGSGQHHRGHHEIPFYKLQQRTVLKPCGLLDPENVHEYIHAGGYEAARKALCEMSPEAVCDEVARAGLRGRGGGGFPTGRKWQLTLAQPGEKKYVICNADEGDPGAFMDRSVMEGNPHAVIEGMTIAARAIGADEGYVYVRLEYPLAVQRIRKAVADAEALGLLGDDLFGSGCSFRLNVMEGAGAFVCGEETALIASIEGQRGMPRPKPPFPAQSGLWGKPTVINNVETLASVPLILLHSAEKYRELGTEGSPGTKTFALTGHVANTGLIEVPFGVTLRKIVFDIGGGVLDDRGRLAPDAFKAVQIGGPSGGCLTEKHLDLPLDFDSLRGAGAMVGSGGLVVMNQQTCMVQMARFFMQFTQNESCGKCVPCREGTKQMLALLDDIIEGRGETQTLELLEQVATAVGKSSLCGLGKTAPNPVLATLRHFGSEIRAHVIDKRCPAGRCKALLKPEILADRCKGCTVCAKKCPVGAISGEKKQPHTIDPAKCIKCGVCAQVCRFGAVVGV